jgi:hypothetical protein
LALGVTGLAVMAFLGFGHHGPDHGGHAGHAAGHGGHDAGHGHHAGDGHGHGESGLGRLTALLSPRLLFSVLVGIGATGLIARPFLVEPLAAAAALAGGWVFERWLVGPIWKLLFRFESRPALMLESVIMEQAEAMMDFDAKGQGLIRLELDGQVVQLLGTLTAEELAHPRRIRRGDLLRIEDVDTARNRCTVSFAGEAPPEVLP